MMQKKHDLHHLSTYVFLLAIAVSFSLSFIITPVIAPVVIVYIPHGTTGWYGEHVEVTSIGGTVEDFGPPIGGRYFSSASFTYETTNGEWWAWYVRCTRTDVELYAHYVFYDSWTLRDRKTVARGPTSGEYETSDMGYAGAYFDKIVGVCIGHFKNDWTGDTWTLKHSYGVDVWGKYVDWSP